MIIISRIDSIKTSYKLINVVEKTFIKISFLDLPTLPVTSVNYATGQWQTIYSPFFGLTPFLHMARTWTITSYQSFSVLTIEVSLSLG